VTFDEYLKAIEEQVRLHGVDALVPTWDMKTKLLGFKSPAGEFTIHVHQIERAYPVKPAPDPELAAVCREFGVEGLAERLTRPSIKDVVRFYSECVRVAIAAGQGRGTGAKA